MSLSFTQLSFLSGRLLISGIAGAEAEPQMKNKPKSHHKQKRARTSINADFIPLLLTLQKNPSVMNFLLLQVFSPVTAPDSLTEDLFVMEYLSDLMQKHAFLLL